MKKQKKFEYVKKLKVLYNIKGLSFLDMDVFSIIHRFTFKNKGCGYCYAGNGYFSEILRRSTWSISGSINKLKKMGLIHQISFDGRRRKLEAINKDKIKKCLWETPKAAFGKPQRLHSGKPKTYIRVNTITNNTPYGVHNGTSKDVQARQKNSRAVSGVFTHSFSACKFSRNRFTRTNKTGTPARTKNQENLLKEKRTNAAGKEKDTPPVKSSDVFRAAAPVRTGRKFMSESEIPKTAKGKLELLSGSKTFVKSNVDMDILRDAYLRDALEIWNSYPGVSKHKIERTKTVRRIRKYLYLLLEGNLYRNVKFEAEYLDRHKLHPWLRHRFTRPEVLQMLRRARSYYLPGYEPMEKGFLPKRFDGFFLRLPEKYNKIKNPASWFLQTCAHKPAILEDMPETVNPKYAYLEELFDDVFLIRTRTDRIDFNRGLDALEKYRAEVIFPEVYRVSSPEKDSECPPGRSQYEITYRTMFWTLGEMMEKYRLWLREPRQEWIRKDRISWLFDPKGQYFLRFIDYTARNNHCIPIIPGREYDDYGNDVYYYGINDNR